MGKEVRPIIINSLEEVHSFLDWKGFSKETARIASSSDNLIYLYCSALNSRTTDDDAQFSPIYTKTRHHNASWVVQCLIHLLLFLLQVSSR